MSSDTVRDALASVARGGMAVIAHDAASEAGGVIAMAAEVATPDRVAFITHHTSGLIRVAVSGERAAELKLSEAAGSPRKAVIGVPVDYLGTASRGLFTVDRALTARKLVDPDAKAEDFTSPGHVFTIPAAPGGLLARNGYAEAAVDLTQLAGCRAGAVISDLVTETGQPAEQAVLRRFAARHRLALMNVDELLAYRRSTESLVARVSETQVRTKFGELTAIGFERRFGSGQIVALTRRERYQVKSWTVYVHEQCIHGELFGSKLCQCAELLDCALESTARVPGNWLLYVGRETGWGLGGSKPHNCSHMCFRFKDIEQVDNMPKEITDILQDLG